MLYFQPHSILLSLPYHEQADIRIQEAHDVYRKTKPFFPPKYLFLQSFVFFPRNLAVLFLAWIGCVSFQETSFLHAVGNTLECILSLNMIKIMLFIN